MCGIAGWVNPREKIREKREIIEDMTAVLDKRGPDDGAIESYDHALLGHRRLIVVDPEGGAQPMTKKIFDNTYTVVYNGELYNTEELRKKLLERGYNFNSYSDTEVLLTSYIEWGEDCVKHFNGIFAFGIWDENKKRLFLARDPLGVKPLFYVKRDKNLIFGSEIKVLLAHPMVEAIIDSQGLLEIFSLGPARAIGSGIFKDICEVPPGSFLIYDDKDFNLREYWTLKAKEHTEDLDTTVEHVRQLLVDAVERQLISDVPLCTFLSGGLDSSAISAIASKVFKREGREKLRSYSIDYQGNDKFFESNEFQPDSDSLWVDRVSKFVGSDHKNILLDIKELAGALPLAVKAMDLPGMADIDSSLYLFSKEVRKDVIVGLSGECADEIFGGYPWYRRPEDINANTFPWSKSVSERSSIISKDLGKLPLEEFVDYQYKKTLRQVPKLEGETPKESRMRELFFLNIKWFMVTLLNRKDRMTMANSLEVRVPFADYRLVEYAYNIPTDFKFADNREKGLLRRALRGILPDDVIYRKKSPYPKTHNPQYLKIVQGWMKEILEDKNSPILQIIDQKRVEEIVKSGGASYGKPWFGQLMTGPQLIAYLIQLNLWMEMYKVQIRL